MAYGETLPDGVQSTLMGHEAPGRVVYRHSIVARLSHWLWALALLVLVMSGLQIFNAAPYLDASDKSNPAHRVLAFGGGVPEGATTPMGMTFIFGKGFVTTGLFGYGDDGQGGAAPRAFPGWLTLPAYQDLAAGRVWHFFFAWMLVIALGAYMISAIARGDIRDLIMRPDDFRKLLPMQLYYMRLRKEPPPHGTYNPLQKLTYNIVLFVMMPLAILTGLALSPGFDALTGPLIQVFGGRQFARLWHFVIMVLFIGYFATHMFLVFATGAWNNVRSMITGRFRLGDHDGVGP
jgi:thiosulfate reductase cytochrome b subunit